MTRDEKVARARELRAEGLLLREIADRMGCGLSTVQAWLSDPDGSQERARKESYGGTCRNCGGRTSGNDGRERAPTVCGSCLNDRRYEQACERVIARIREWVVLYGSPPAAYEWHPGMAEKNGRPDVAARHREACGHWPWQPSVSRLFGSWNAAIKAAGFTPRKQGHRKDRP